jgi:hypothetical protein
VFLAVLRRGIFNTKELVLISQDAIYGVNSYDDEGEEISAIGLCNLVGSLIYARHFHLWNVLKAECRSLFVDSDTASRLRYMENAIIFPETLVVVRELSETVILWDAPLSFGINLATLNTVSDLSEVLLPSDAKLR